MIYIIAIALLSIFAIWLSVRLYRNRPLTEIEIRNLKRTMTYCSPDKRTRFWSKALSRREIRYLYNDGKGIGYDSFGEKK